jgi:hypothetical protein
MPGTKRLLHPDAFDRARRFLKTRARPLDRTLFEFRFEGAPAQRVIARLNGFRNAEGGFGRALEPDVRTPTSSALATGIALRILRELRCPASHAMVRDAVRFLQTILVEGDQVWRAIPEDANSFPHAPWWHDDQGSLARTFDDFLIVPRAELVGLLHHFSSLVPPDWLCRLTECTVRDIETIESLGSGGGDDLVYCLSLLETESLPSDFAQRVARRLRDVIPAAVSHDPEEWTSYCITPLKVAPSPRSFAADLVQEPLQAHLDYVIEHQMPDGAWDPVWSWGDLFPEAWQLARQEWRGHLALEALASLRAFERLQE